MSIVTIFSEIHNERIRQDVKWGGSRHDDKHTTGEFVQLIEDYAGWARTQATMGNMDNARERLKQVAALSVAAIESIDRAQNLER